MNVPKGVVDSDTVLDEQVQIEYRRYSLETLADRGKTAAYLVIAIIPIFLYRDLYVINLPSAMIPFRIVPIVLALLFLVMSFSPLKRFLRVQRALYFVFLFSLMIMGSALVRFTYLLGYKHLGLVAMLVVIFCVYLAAIYGTKMLLPLYLLPLPVLLLFLSYVDGHSSLVLLDFSALFVFAVVCLVSAHSLEKKKFNEFKTNKIMELQNFKLINRNQIILRKNENLNKELSLARRIQRNIIPVKLPRRDGINIAAYYKPMFEIGGDLYDVIEFEDEQMLGVFIGDVSGHGVSAALIAGMLKTFLLMSGDYYRDPAGLMKYLNDKLIGQISGNFATAFYCLFDLSRGRLSYARAGHNYPYLIRSKEVIELEAPGKLLGIVENAYYETREMEILPGDRFILCTDGLLEAEDNKGNAFEGTLMEKLLPLCGEMNSDIMVKCIYTSLEEYIGSRAIDDDICIIGIEISGEEKNSCN